MFGFAKFTENLRHPSYINISIYIFKSNYRYTDKQTYISQNQFIFTIRGITVYTQTGQTSQTNS